MAKETPIVAKTLRLVSFSITLAGFVILGTIGYSIYEEFNYLFFSGPGDLFEFTREEKDDSIDFFFNLTIPNKGLFPLEIEVNLTASLGGNEISSGSSGVAVIPVGSEEQLEILVTMRKDDIAELISLQSQEIELDFTVRAGFQPFAFIQITAGQDFVDGVRQLDFPKEDNSNVMSDHSIARLKLR
ncbi:MAG: hypothetical protein V3U49_02235 [Nitrososphaerales archaeon]